MASSDTAAYSFWLCSCTCIVHKQMANIFMCVFPLTLFTSTQHQH